MQLLHESFRGTVTAVPAESAAFAALSSQQIAALGQVTRAEFDDFAELYRQQHASSIAISGEDTDFFAAYKVSAIKQELASDGLTPDMVLDFGSGIGNSLPYLRGAFPRADITCLDVSLKSLDLSQQRFPGAARACHFDGRSIPFPDNHFDLIFTACVFHHIPEEQHLAALREIRRVLTPGGRFFLFEHNPLNPLTRMAVHACPFDKEAVLIGAGEMRRRFERADFANVDTRFRLFFPRYLAWFRPLESLLTKVPFGAQYSICASK